MREYTYLFEENDNGYGLNCVRTYFSCNKELDQEEVEKLIRFYNGAAGRTGSTFKDLQEGAKKEGIIIEPIKSYLLDKKIDGKFENITGNY